MDIIQKSNSYDSIIDLPTDKTQPTLAEVKIVNTLFKHNKPEKKDSSKKVGIKYNLQYVFLLFLIMASNLLDISKMPELFQKSPLLFNILKAFLIVLVFFIFQKMYM